MLGKMRCVMRSACDWERKLFEAQFPMNVLSSTGIWRVSPSCTAKPVRDCRATKEVGDVELEGSHPGARTAYAVLDDAGTVSSGLQNQLRPPFGCVGPFKFPAHSQTASGYWQRR